MAFFFMYESIYLLATKLKKEWFGERQFTSKPENWKRNLTDYLTPWLTGLYSMPVLINESYGLPLCDTGVEFSPQMRIQRGERESQEFFQAFLRNRSQFPYITFSMSSAE